MYVTVSLMIEVDASAKLSQLESQIEEAGRAAMKEALKQAIQQNEAQQIRYPACGSEQCHSQGTKRRVLLTRFGRVEVPLKRLRCSACGQLFRPKDALFGRGDGTQCQPGVARTRSPGGQFVAE
jgi:hypothetical protein